jgi:hypothetical protein
LKLAAGDLVSPYGVRLSVESAHVVDEAARYRGRKDRRYADHLVHAVDHIRERNSDQSRDRNDDDISPQQHGKPFNRPGEQAGVSFGAIRTARFNIGPTSMSAGKSQTKSVRVLF